MKRAIVILILFVAAAFFAVQSFGSYFSGAVYAPLQKPAITPSTTTTVPTATAAQRANQDGIGGAPRRTSGIAPSGASGNASSSHGDFQGPSGPPHIIGPSGPPPGS
jgi:hypothetical protein